MGGRLAESLTALAAVATLPIGILAAIFLGPVPSLVVFVVGWLLVVPVLGVLAGLARQTDPEEVERWMDVAERTRAMAGDGRSTDEDPLETLRERYARGEIDDEAFEARLETLIGTEEIPPEAVDPETVDGERLRER